MKTNGAPRSSQPAPSADGRDGMRRAAWLLAIAISSLTVVSLVTRLRFGADLWDEAYYAAGSYRFALGMRPLLDDLGPHQFASYLTTPFVWAWLAVRGNLDGVILWLRIVYLAGSLVAAATAFAFLRKVVDVRIALLSAAYSLCLVPWLIFAPSYNTTAIAALTVAASLAGIGLLEPDRRWLFGASGAALGLAAVAYPTLAVVLVVAVALLAWSTRSTRAVAWMAAGGLLVIGLFVASLGAGLGGLGDFLAFNRLLAAQTGWLGGQPKLWGIALGVVLDTYRTPTAWLCLAVVGYRVARRRVPTVLTVLLPLSTPLALYVTLPHMRTMLAAFLMLLAVFASGLGPLERTPRRAIGYALAIGSVAAAVIAFTSTNGAASLGLGAAAVGASGMAILLNNARASLAEHLGESPATLGAAAVGAVVVCMVAVLCWQASYGGPTPLVMHVPQVGPFAGLVADRDAASTVESMTADLAAIAGPDSRLLAFGAQPAVYLMSRARPVTPFLWLGDKAGTPPAKAAFVEKWIANSEHSPDIVVIGGETWTSTTLQASDRLLRYLEARYRVVTVRRGYTILTAR